VGLPTWWRRGTRGHGFLGGRLEAGLDDGKSPFDLRVARTELRRIEIKQGQRLRQDEGMASMSRSLRSAAASGRDSCPACGSTDFTTLQSQERTNAYD
jgi:hypothetical protein